MLKNTWYVGLLSLASLFGCGGNAESPIKPVLPPMEPITVAPPTPQAEFIGFESAPVRPIARSTNGAMVFVANTSNNSVEIFQLNKGGELSHQQSVAVGLEPVAVAYRENEVWVSNHLSDSVSIIDLTTTPARIKRTLLVGDEPRDIVFAKNSAFISTAHRGQHRSYPSLAQVQGAGEANLHAGQQGRADIWVFDVHDQGSSLGGKPKKIVTFFGDTLRGLAVTPDQETVYAAVLHSGNQTTAVHESVLCPGFEDDEYGAYPCQLLDNKTSPNGLAEGYLPGGRTAPGVNSKGESQPWTSMIVKYDQQSGQWQDSIGRNFSNGVRFMLPDYDVFALDTDSLEQSAVFSGVGTTLFNVSVNPVSGSVYVSNTDANNSIRFEGGGRFAGSTVQGQIAKTQITVISPQDGKVKPRHLNRHVNYADLKGNHDQKHHSLSTPMQLATSADGSTLYSAVIGSNKVAVFPTKKLEDDKYWDNQAPEFSPLQLSQHYINVDGGPAGLLLDEKNDSLLVFTRFDNSLVRINLVDNSEQQRIALATFEPSNFMMGRAFLYDAQHSSSNGEASCASCHIFADTDHLSWNLGNPDAENERNLQPFPTENFSELGCLLVGPDEESCQLLNIINGNGDKRSIASMKGPMMTQTLRGMSNHGHMHWRGDRSNGYFGVDQQQTLDEKISFKNFIVAYEGLLGLDINLPNSVMAQDKSQRVLALEADIDKFADFALALALPPNPIRNLDNSLSTSAQRGADFFHGNRRSDGIAEDTLLNGDNVDGVNCQGCHGVDHAQGFYGTRGEIAHGGEIQIFKVPQLRNLYTRVGMYGLPDREGFLPSHTSDYQGEQIRGFGFLHDGATDQLLNFLKGGVFDNGETGCPKGIDERYGCHFNNGVIGIPDELTRQGLVDYMMEFDNDIAPIVGQQITLSSSSSAEVEKRINLLEQRARTPFVSKLLGGKVTECDLIVLGTVDEQQRGYFYQNKEEKYRADSQDESLLTSEQIKSLAKFNGNSLTFTCTVPGKGWQAALDRDLDGVLNADE